MSVTSNIGKHPKSLSQQEFLRCSMALKEEKDWCLATKPNNEKLAEKLSVMVGFEITKSNAKAVRNAAKELWGISWNDYKGNGVRTSGQFKILSRCLMEIYQKMGNAVDLQKPSSIR